MLDKYTLLINMRIQAAETNLQNREETQDRKEGRKERGNRDVVCVIVFTEAAHKEFDSIEKGLFLNCCVEVFNVIECFVDEEVVFACIFVDVIDQLLHLKGAPEGEVLAARMFQNCVQTDRYETEETRVRERRAGADRADSYPVLFHRQVDVGDSSRLGFPCVWKPLRVQP